MEKKNFLFGVVALAGAALFGNPANLDVSLSVTNASPVIKIKNAAGTSDLTTHAFPAVEYPYSGADLSLAYKVVVEDKGAFGTYRVDLTTNNAAYVFKDGSKQLAFSVYVNGSTTALGYGNAVIGSTNSETASSDVVLKVLATDINGVTGHTINGSVQLIHTIVNSFI